MDNRKGVLPSADDGSAHPNIIYEEPDDEASSSDKDVSDERMKKRKVLFEADLTEGRGGEGPSTEVNEFDAFFRALEKCHFLLVSRCATTPMIFGAQCQ
ncbi:hypothetical protein L1987_00927 [Smallanthus sonchifolius]|uniref:Uncharacterized protein n=1 Tax=Smallanthus sonchifolius TaxID=185202 RepID=A0ACB9K3Q1_9ASTR|nr:hypothetical protein L1987_00927 [Smallanthus sonchifolius]